MNRRSLECRGTRADRGLVRLTKSGLWSKSCNDFYLRVVCEQSLAIIFTQGWFANEVFTRTDRSAPSMIQWQFGKLRRGNCKGRTAKEEECWWQQMGIVKRRFRLVVRLKAIEYYEGLLCYLSSYNLLVSDLWLDPDLMLRPLIQGWCVAFATHTPHPMSGRNRNRYYYLFSTSFVRSFVRSLVRALVRSFVHALACSCARSFVRSFVRALVRSCVLVLALWLYPLKCERSKT